MSCANNDGELTFNLEAWQAESNSREKYAFTMTKDQAILMVQGTYSLTNILVVFNQFVIRAFFFQLMNLRKTKYLVNQYGWSWDQNHLKNKISDAINPNRVIFDVF